MIRTKLFLACALAFAVSLAGTSAFAQEPANQITYFTFSAPFELPGGKTLPAGKYVFKIVDSPSNRHVVQVMSEDQQTMHATLLAIPAQRRDPADEPEVRFMEAAANTAPAIRTWWYPGRTIGHEFIYPKDHARRLAARQGSGEGVLTTAGTSTADDAMRSGDLARINAAGQENPWSADTTVAENTTMPDQTRTTAQSTTAQSAQTTATSPVTSSTQSTATESTSPTAATQPTTADQPRSADRTTSNNPTRQSDTTRTADTSTTSNTRTALPRTASPLPLVGLLGLASLLGAGLLRLRQ